MYFGMYDSARQMKKAREADIAFYLRRKFRRIRAEARVIDPNANFRLSAKAMEAGSVVMAIRRADQQRREEQQRIAQINARDRKLALKEAGTTRLPSRSR